MPQPPTLPDIGLLVYLPCGGVVRAFRTWARSLRMGRHPSGGGPRSIDPRAIDCDRRYLEQPPTLAMRLSPDEAQVMASPFAMLAGAELKPVSLRQEFWGHA